MFTPTVTPKKLKLPSSTGFATPVSRLMDYYSKAPNVRLRARKPKTCGKRTKLGITRFLWEVFSQNELLPRRDKLTNEKIAAMLLAEFPDQETLHRGLEQGGKNSVNDYRRRYNSGTLVKDCFPDRCSFRYSAEGLAVDTRTGRRLLSAQEQGQIAQKFKDQFARSKRPRRQLPEAAPQE